MKEHRIYSSLILVSKEKMSVEAIKHELRSDDGEIATYFQENYGRAYKFFYHEFFRKELEIEYLGRQQIDISSMGNLILDFVYIRNRLLKMNSLHIHFNFLGVNSRFSLLDDNSSEKKSPIIKGLAGFLNKVYNTFGYTKDYDTGIQSLNRIRYLILHDKPDRSYAFSISKYIYTSICNLDEATVQDWRKFSENIWRILFFHSEGTDADLAEDYLSRNNWSSTSFFRNFYQPGALVSLSSPYPALIYKSNYGWFSGNDINGRLSIEWPEDYDLLPEYPPLRYLGLLSLEFAGFIEETLRFLYDKMLKMQDGPFKVIRCIFTLPRLEALYYKSLNHEYLRLPITREFASSLINSKIQETIRENFRDLRSSMLNGVMLIIAIAALIIAFVQIITSFTGN